MKTFEYTITDELGIHARPAGMLVKEASKFASKIMIASPKKEVDAKRIMGVMSMGAKKGDTVKLRKRRSDVFSSKQFVMEYIVIHKAPQKCGIYKEEGTLL